MIYSMYIVKFDSEYKNTTALLSVKQQSIKEKWQ